MAALMSPAVLSKAHELHIAFYKRFLFTFEIEPQGASAAHVSK
jgi:hypothetical protein